MTIQDGNINKHLDDKPPVDKLFIWSIVIILVIISILLVILLKPEIFTNILDRFIPDDSNSGVVEKQKEEPKKEESHIMEDATYEEIDAKEANKYYEKVYYMSEYLKDNEYIFMNDYMNIEYQSIWTDALENFPVWYILNAEYDKALKPKAILQDDVSYEAKLDINGTPYKATSKYVKATDLENLYHKTYPIDFKYNRQDQIGYGGCYVAVYNAELDGFIIYKNTNPCEGGLYKVNYKLYKAEKIEDCIYLYEKNVETNEEFMYTLTKEDDTYKIVSRIKHVMEVVK